MGNSVGSVPWGIISGRIDLAKHFEAHPIVDVDWFHLLKKLLSRPHFVAPTLHTIFEAHELYQNFVIAQHRS